MARKLIVEVVGDASSLERTFSRSSRATRDFDRDLSRSARGALAATVSFRGLGRAVAFGSNAFLGGAGLAFAIKSTIQAAEDSQRVLAQTENAVKSAGLSWAAYGKQVQAAALAESKISGFDDERLLATFSSLVRATGNVNKALELNALAADVARGRNVSLESATQLVIKANAGMAGSVRRVLPFLGKHATATQLIGALQQKYAGAAEAYGKTAAGAQDRFRVAVQNLQEAIGAGLLPEITKLLNPISDWLNESKNQERVQRDVTKAAKDAAGVFKSLRDVIHDVDGVTGSFKHTLELLVGLRIAFWARGVQTAIGGIGTSAVTAEGEVNGLRTSLGALSAIAVAPIVIPIQISFGQKERAFLEKHAGLLGNAGKALLDIATAGGAVTGGNIVKDLGGGIVNSSRFSQPDIPPTAPTGTDPAVEAAAKAAASRARSVADQVTAAQKAIDDAVKKAGPRLTAEQRNKFFDNEIARILLRGGLGDIQQQITALETADRLIEQRLKVTKDVTRRLNLEDELLQNQAQIRSLEKQASDARQQAAQDALQKRKDAFAEIIANLQLGVTAAQATRPISDDIAQLKKLEAGIEAEIKEFGRTADLAGQLFDVRQQLTAARAQQATGRQFLALGLTETGEPRIPGVRALRRALGNVDDAIQGTFLDTRKTESLLASIRRVLSGGLGQVGEEVRSKIQQILGDLNRQLDNSTQKNLTKWRHLSSAAFLAGIPDLTPEQKRIITARLSVLGPGGSVPGARSAAFSLAGAQTVGGGDVYLDGEKVGRITHSHGIRRDVRRTVPRNG